MAPSSGFPGYNQSWSLVAFSFKSPFSVVFPGHSLPLSPGPQGQPALFLAECGRRPLGPLLAALWTGKPPALALNGMLSSAFLPWSHAVAGVATWSLMRGRI